MRALLLAMLLPAASFAADGAALLLEVDEALNRSEDMTFVYDLVNMEPGRDPKAMQLSVIVKDEKRMTEFLAPGDMKGTKALVQGQSKMYIYLPAYNKVRRVSSSLTEGGFMGTTFANEDISTTEYSPYYDGAVTSETDTSYVVTATPKEGVKVGYSKLEITIDKKMKLPSELKYFNKKGTHTKTETRSNFSCEGEVCNAGEMTMVDHSRGDASTSLLRKSWSVNDGIDDDIFTVRALQK